MMRVPEAALARASPTPSAASVVGRLEQRVAGAARAPSSLLTQLAGEDRARAVALLDVLTVSCARRERAASASRRTRRAASAKSAYCARRRACRRTASRARRRPALFFAQLASISLRDRCPGPRRSPSCDVEVLARRGSCCPWRAACMPPSSSAARRSCSASSLVSAEAVHGVHAGEGHDRQGQAERAEGASKPDGERKIANRGHASSGRRVALGLKRRESFSGALGAFVCQR